MIKLIACIRAVTPGLGSSLPALAFCISSIMAGACHHMNRPTIGIMTKIQSHAMRISSGRFLNQIGVGFSDAFSKTAAWSVRRVQLQRIALMVSPHRHGDGNVPSLNPMSASKQ